MDDSTESPIAEAASARAEAGVAAKAAPAGAFAAALAGLQAGMLGALAMLLWFGIDSSWDGRSFWREENLFASCFYGNDAARAGFGFRTMPGIALFLIVYSLLGCIFGLLLRDRFRPIRAFLMAEIFAIGWYYISFHALWKSALPLVYLFSADRPTIVGHLIYGVCLAQFREYLRSANAGAAAAIAPGATQ